VNGYALGGGMTLVNNAELAIASSTATFGAPEITFGVYAALAGPSTTRRVLPKHVAQLVLTGERIDADTALRWGMINEVVAPEDLLPRAEQLAAHIAAFDRTALDVAKNALRAEHLMDWDAALDHGTRTTAFIGAQKKANEV
jgi:enoyl-CoA hydratase/carnithine racemase